jgi:hypothetical protein
VAAHGKKDTVMLSNQSHVARSPRVIASGKDVWVVWQDEDGEHPHRPVIRLRHSSNGGREFGKPVQLSDAMAAPSSCYRAAEERLPRGRLGGQRRRRVRRTGSRHAGQSPTGNTDPDNWQIMSSVRSATGAAWSPRR